MAAKKISVRVVNFPKWELLKSKVPHISPLDMLYWHGLGHYIAKPEEILIEPKAVFISAEDAEELYELFYSHFENFFGGENLEESVATIWLHYGPSVTTDLPKGKMGLEDGYIQMG